MGSERLFRSNAIANFKKLLTAVDTSVNVNMYLCTFTCVCMCMYIPLKGRMRNYEILTCTRIISTFLPNTSIVYNL